jgi:hypothetical protein
VWILPLWILVSVRGRPIYDLFFNSKTES